MEFGEGFEEEDSPMVPARQNGEDIAVPQERTHELSQSGSRAAAGTPISQQEPGLPVSSSNGHGNDEDDVVMTGYNASGRAASTETGSFAMRPESNGHSSNGAARRTDVPTPLDMRQQLHRVNRPQEYQEAGSSSFTSHALPPPPHSAASSYHYPHMASPYGAAPIPRSQSFALPQPGSAGYGRTPTSVTPSSSGTFYSPTSNPNRLPGVYSQMNARYAAVVPPQGSACSPGIPWHYAAPEPSPAGPDFAQYTRSSTGSLYQQPSAPASSSKQHTNGASSSSRNGTLVTSSSAGVIDLTEGDDGDDQSDNEDDDEEVTVKSEKLPLRDPNGRVGKDIEDDDDDLQIVGEKTTEKNAPLCIGQLTGVALILYPIPELRPSPDPAKKAPTPLQVALLRATPLMKPNGVKDETIKLYSSDTGTNFGVMEQRLANVLGPMMTRDNKRGLGIWVEAWVVRTNEKSPYMLPLVMLLFCHPHIVPNISSALEKSVVYLEHPLSYDPALHNHFRYYNPHTSHIVNAEADRRRQQVMAGISGQGISGGYKYGRFSNGASGSMAAKSVEVQREQVEEMFKTIQSGADLGEVEPDPMVSTKLYPHQKQALAFLIDREKLRTMEKLRMRKTSSMSNSAEGGDMTREEEDEMISLWRPARDIYGKFIGWHNLITEVEIGSDRPPPQCRGAILADDMGLGKTIVIISLIANSLNDARKFASEPICKESNASGSFDALAVHPTGNKAGSSTVSQTDFKSFIPGVSNGASSSAVTQKKKKGKGVRQKAREENESARLNRLVRRSKGTLIVCPLSTVVNWESQIEEHIGLAGGTAVTRKAPRKCNNSDSGTSTPTTGLSVYIYHGPDRNTDVNRLSEFDVVITTFSTLASEFSKQKRKEQQDEADTESSDGGIEEVDAVGKPVKAKGKRKARKIQGDATSPLQQIEWFRVVLDEAHQIKEHTTMQAYAACELSAERRVCLTGTPLQNSLSDLFSLMRFLKLEPFTDKGIWTAYIGNPAKLGDPLGVSRLQLLMRHLALRRTKQSTDKQGKPILSIPPKKEEIRYLTLSDEEQSFYISHHSRYKHNFEMLDKTDSISKNYCSILQEVLRLRQICAHMAMVRDSEDRAMANGEGETDIVSAMQTYGITKSRALRLLALMRDTGAAQCAECGIELASPGLNPAQDDMEEDEKPSKKRRRITKPAKNNGPAKVDSDDNNINPSAPCPVLTRCQHLFCLPCFQKNVAVNYPDAVTAADRSTCSICREEISPVIDAVQVSSTDIDTLGVGDTTDDAPAKSSKAKKAADRYIEHSTKTRQLVSDLFLLSQNNPASANYAGDAADLSLCDADEEFRPHPREATKTVVFSQWTSMLDRTEDALRETNIKYTRLDGSMQRADRNRALGTFKSDMSCEVLLVSLRAGGVGLNLTHASRVYMMEPSWNPSVEHQAIDRIHRLGQTRPVKCIRFIVEKSIEANMLEIQERKQKLANMSLSQTLSKAELAESRREDLRTLFK